MTRGLGLLVIDMQRELLTRPVFRKQDLIENVNCLIARFHEANEPVFMVRHANDSFLKAGSDGWQLDPGLSFGDTDTCVDKMHSSVFKEKGFKSLLEEAGVTTLVVTGLVSNGCVQAACTDAIKHGYSVVLVSDAHSTFHKQAEKVIADWNQKLEEQGARVITTAQFLAGGFMRAE